MAHTFNYSVLVAIPSQRRGERVNIGIVVFLADRLDIRVPDISKLRCISSGDWSEYVSHAVDSLRDNFVANEDPAQFIARFATHEAVIRPSDLGWFSVDEPEHYEPEVNSILSDLVIYPKEDRIRAKSSKINSQIASEFRKSQILAKRGDTIDDHKVQRNYYVSTDADLRADFVVKNGTYHVTATLDLRREALHISQATWKAVVLYEAQRAFGSKTRRLAVYAAAHGASQFRPHIGILRDFSDAIFNWADPDGQRAYKQAIFDALRGSLPPGALI